MVTRRLCAFRFPTGEPCHSPPLHDGDYCLMHSREHAKEVQEARRIGGLHRKREATLSAAFDFAGLKTVDGIRRLLEIAATDALGMENSPARSRMLVYVALAALRTLEVGVFEEHLAVLEQAVHGQRSQSAIQSMFDFEIDPPQLGSGDKEDLNETRKTSGQN